MNTRKLLVKISYGFIAALVIVLVVLLVYRQRQIRQMSQNEAPAPSATVTRSPVDIQTASAAGGGDKKMAAEADNLRYQLKASEEELDMVREDLSERKDGNLEELLAMDEKMRENPTLMNMMRRDIENNVSKTYGTLFERLGLSAEKIQAFKTLLVDFDMQEEEMSMGLMDQSLTEEEKNEILQRAEDMDAEKEKQMMALLGTKDYEIYDAYQERNRERSFVTGVLNPLRTDLGLSDEKEQALIDVMYEARKGVEADYGFDSSGMTLAINAGRNLSDTKNRELDIYDSYLESARSILSDSEIGQFETRINERKEMMKMIRPLQGSADEES